MFKKTHVIAAIGIFTLLSSCREEITIDNNETIGSKLDEGVVKNGRLYFSSKEALNAAYDKVKDADDETIAKYIDSKNIISLRPVITKDNEMKISQQFNKRIELLKQNKRYMSYLASKGVVSKTENEEELEDDIDDLEEIIGDDAYSAFLDSRAEIQVGNQIYKYTDVGLFIVEDTKYSKLVEYLAVREISDNLMYATEDSIKKAYIESQPTEEKITVATDIEYFNAYQRQVANPNINVQVANYPPNPGNPGNPNTTDPNVVLNNYILAMPLCQIKHGVFGSLFGENDVCIDRYEDKYRVKTKAFNYNYFLVYHLGVKVKHQYKGWVSWRKEEAQELRLGVQGLQFQYDFSGSFVPLSNNFTKTNIYTGSTRYQYDASTFWSPNSYGAYDMTGFSMPSFPKLMQDDIVIENFGRNISADIVGIALAQGNRQLKGDNLNKLFWEQSIKELRDFWTKTGRPAPAALDNNITLFRKYPDFGKVLIQKTHFIHRYNEDVLEKTFDFGAEIKLNIDPNSGNIDVSPGTTIKKPEDFMVKMYGIAKRNGKWHGNKIDNTR